MPQEILQDMLNVLKKLHEGKPLDRSEAARYWAISITDMEKLIAFFQCFVVLPDKKYREEKETYE